MDKTYFKNLKYLPLIIFLKLFDIFLLPIQSKSFNNEYYALDEKIVYLEDFQKKSFFFNRNKFIGVFNNDLRRIENTLISTLISNSREKNKEFLLDLESDVQYQTDNILTAEGNVILYMSNSKLKADKVTYDRENKTFVAEGNLKFYKGNQYFEASNLKYSLITKKGYIENIYGVLNIKTINEDFELSNQDLDEKLNLEVQNDNLGNLTYKDSATFGFVNDFEKDSGFNISELELKVPAISKWRFKSEKLIFDSDSLKSDIVYFTNDPINKPQLIFESRNFKTEILNDKVKLTSKNTWINLDNRFRFPIGRRNLLDKDPLTRWGLGSDISEKDGIYIFRGSDEISLVKDFSLKLQPYFLIQRAIEGNTNSFRDSGTSIFSDTKKSDAQFSDYFALDIEFKGNSNDWDIVWESSLNSLNLERFDQASRSRFSLMKTYELNSKKSEKFLTQNPENDQTMFFRNFFDFEIYSSYREKVSRKYAGDQEIYFGNGLNIANRRIWNENNVNSNLDFIYDFGEFNAKKRNISQLTKLSRHGFLIKYNYKFPLWEKEIIKSNIDENYKYTPKVIDEGINWISEFKGSYLIYSNNDYQSSISFDTGPELIIGSLSKDFFDFTKLNTSLSYVIKNGESPFAFDDIIESTRLKINLDQQIIGPLLFSYETSLNLDNGQYTHPIYAINIKRRAYSLGAFYNTNNESIGLKFNIFNFDFSGKNSRF